MRILDQLKEHEGFRGQPYKCSAGKTTIGYGRNLESKPLSEEEATYLLLSDIEDATKNAERYPFFYTLNEARQAVIIDMIFNLGNVGFKRFKKTIKALNAFNYNAAAQEMLDSTWAKQVQTRAIRLAEQMRTGEYQ